MAGMIGSKVEKANDEIQGHAGDDTLAGGSGNDWLEGDEGDDILAGHEGEDELYGNGDDDYLDGGDDDDELYGGTGDDYLDGGAGDDELDGGTPAMTRCGVAPAEISSCFRRGTAMTRSRDFTDGEDEIDLTAFTGITGFGDLTITADGDDTVINLTNHEGGTIRLENFEVADLDAEDFIFADDGWMYGTEARGHMGRHRRRRKNTTA